MIRTVRILSIPLKANLTLFEALINIYGLGPTRIHTLLHHSYLLPHQILGKLTTNERSRLTFSLNYFRLVKGWLLHTTLRKIKYDRIQSKSYIYQGIRHQLRLPVRGQRTRSNSRTVRRQR